MFQQAFDTISKQVLIRADATTISSAANSSRPSRAAISTIRARSPAPSCARSRAPPPPTSSSRSTPPTRPRTPGARPRRPSAPCILNKIADRMEANLELLALVETLDNGKPIRETTYADLPLVRRSLALFRRLHPRPGRRALGDRPRHRRLSLPRAARRRRPDHPLELPAADGGLEARARARRRQLRGAQAGRADPAQHPGAGRTDRRPAAARRAQRRQRLRPRGGQAAGAEQAHRQDRLHRRDDDRPPDHAIRQPRTSSR